MEASRRMIRHVTFASFLVFFVTTPCHAQETMAAAGAVTSGLTILDWGIIAFYAIGTIGLGWFYSRKQGSASEYFVGSGHMNPLLIGVSLFATLLSTISYLSMPGESLGKGPMYMVSMLSLPAVYFVVGFLILPVYMKQRVTSAYELLEQRLGRGIRLLGAGMFIIMRLGWMSLLTYTAAKAVTVMMGVGDNMIPVIALVTGFVAVIYTSLGGLRAVVITDLMQTILLFGGAVLVLILITIDLGGFSWVPTKWNPSWDVQPVFSTNLSTRVTLVGSLLNYFVWYVCTAAGDQTSVQRFMATRDASSARKAFGTQLVVSVLVALTLGSVGFALIGYFQAHPGILPNGMTLSANADEIFPHFIAFHLPPGISGLVVAAMFAAAMSSIDSGVNSITAVVVADFLGHRQPDTSINSAVMESSEVEGSSPGEDEGNPYVTPQNQDVAVLPAAPMDRRQLVTARWLAFGIGAFVVVTSSFMGLIPGNITAVTTKTANLLATPIFALFFFAIFVPFASPKGVTIGAVLGTTCAILIAFSGPLFGFVADDKGQITRDPISFQWIAPAAIVVNITAGCVGSWIFPRKED